MPPGSAVWTTLCYRARMPLRSRHELSRPDATKSYKKYYHLLRELQRVGFFRLPTDLESYVFPTPRPGLTKKLSEISLTEVRPTIEVLYVQPLASTSESSIDFARFAYHVSQHPDPLSQRFTRSLLSWCQPAGVLEAAEEIVCCDGPATR